MYKQGMILKYKNGITWKVVRRYKDAFDARLIDNGRSSYSRDRIGEIMHFKDWEFDQNEWAISYDFQGYLKEAELC